MGYPNRTATYTRAQAVYYTRFNNAVAYLGDRLWSSQKVTKLDGRPLLQRLRDEACIKIGRESIR